MARLAWHARDVNLATFADSLLGYASGRRGSGWRRVNSFSFLALIHSYPPSGWSWEVEREDTNSSHPPPIRYLLQPPPFPPTHVPRGSITELGLGEVIARASYSLRHPSRGQDLPRGLLTLARWKFPVFEDHWGSHLLWHFVPRNTERGKCNKDSFPGHVEGTAGCFLVSAFFFFSLSVTWN